MSKQKYVPIKPHINIGSIRHVNSGKQSLTENLTKYLSEKGYNETDDIFQSHECGITINPSSAEKIERSQKVKTK